MKPFIVGISAFYHDSSICLFKNGELVFACEEEKFTGVKHDSRFPLEGWNYILKEFKLTPDNIEAVCYYEDPQLKLKRVIKNIKPQIFKNLKFSIDSYLKIKRNIKDLTSYLEAISNNVFYSTHHESHLYYSYYTSDFNEAACLSVDGVGEFCTAALGIPTEDGLRIHSLAEYPHSLGLFYSAMTAFLGFRPNEGEYKVMGLASYGNSERFIKQVRNLINFDDGKLTCNMDVFTWDRSNQTMFNEDLSTMFYICSRLPEYPITQDHKDLAAAVQEHYEDILYHLIYKVYQSTGEHDLCLGGGCAYNGSANGKIKIFTHFDRLWIPPAPSDAGSSVGACIHYLVKNGKLKGRIPKNPFLGPKFSDAEIRAAMKGYTNYHLTYRSNSALIKHIAERLSQGKIVGWYQGHIEFGARALGNRSILADPRDPKMKDRINKVIKKRESFRPFAPAVIKEKQSNYFIMREDIPYMNQVVKVKDDYVTKLGAVTHVDGTARVQTVYPNTLFHNLLEEFETLTGYPILLNTSFNVKDKTMVLTPQQAIETFLDTDMDILVMNRIVMYK